MAISDVWLHILGQPKRLKSPGAKRSSKPIFSKHLKSSAVVAMEWLAELKTNRASERKQKLRWEKIAGWSGIIGVGVAIAGIIVAIWLAK